MPALAPNPPASLSPTPLPPRRRRRWPVGTLALVGVAALFTLGVVRLFDLRFSTGDVYPIYSSLRGDPLGTKALYYSLQALPGLRVERNVRPLRYLGEEPSAVLRHRDDDPDPTGGSGPAAVLYLGTGPFGWPYLFNEAEAVRLETLMNRGGRVILAFLPTTVEMTGKRLEYSREKEEKSRKGEKGGDAKDKDKASNKDKDADHDKPKDKAGDPLKDDKPKDKGNDPVKDDKPKEGGRTADGSPRDSGKPPSGGPAQPTPTTGKKEADPQKGNDGRGQPTPTAPKKEDQPGKPAGAGKEPKNEGPPASPTPAAAATPTPMPEPLSPSEKLLAREDLIPRWHVDFLRRKDDTDKPAGKTSPAGKAGPTPAPTPPPLDDSAVPAPGLPAGLKPVSWHSTVDFDLDPPETKQAGWRSLYTRSGRPVIVARPFGTAGGELILASDPYLFSNEALRKEPHPTLLATLIGPCRRIIFDETHLGIAENPGLMTLARRYHLQGAVAALVVLAILFLWKNMVSLVPPTRAGAAAAGGDAGGVDGLPADGSGGAGAVAGGNSYVPGRDSAEGFVNLLRRGVPTGNLIATCLAQWRAANALPGGREPSAEVVARLNAIAQEEAAKPVHRRSVAAAYRAMCAALKRR